MEELQDIEEDAGLGNGGLGRLAGECLSVCLSVCLSRLDAILPQDQLWVRKDSLVHQNSFDLLPTHVFTRNIVSV